VPPPSIADVKAAAAAKRPPPPPAERRNCSMCHKLRRNRAGEMKDDWDKPADERKCESCKNRLARALVEEPVRLDEVVYIQSGDNYSTSIEVPNGANGQRCKVVVEVPLKIVKDEGEDAKQERARAAVSRRINKRGSCHGKVVNADDGGKLGEHLTHVHCVKLDAVNCYLYVKQKKVLEALAKTQNGTRPPPKKDHGPFYPDQNCNFLGH